MQDHTHGYENVIFKYKTNKICSILLVPLHLTEKINIKTESKIETLIINFSEISIVK